MEIADVKISFDRYLNDNEDVIVLYSHKYDNVRDIYNIIRDIMVRQSMPYLTAAFEDGDLWEYESGIPYHKLGKHGYLIFVKYQNAGIARLRQIVDLSISRYFVEHGE